MSPRSDLVAARKETVAPGTDPSGRERRLVSKLTTLLTRGMPLLFIAGIVALPVPYLFGWGNASTIIIPAFGLLLGLGFALTESGVDRKLFLSLYLVGYLLRFGAVVVVAAITANHPPLGPDSTTYLRESQILAANHLSMNTHPSAYNGLGTFDVAHYYLFAFFIMVSGADLLGLQLLNCVLAALVAPLMFAWCRRVTRRYALFVGAGLAMHPSLIALASIDLLKDPSIMFFAAVALWALSRFGERRLGAAAAAFFAIAVASLVYLRMDRFFLVAIAELAAIMSGVIFLRRAGVKREILARSLPAILLFLVVEAGPLAVGWPPSAVLVYRNIENVLRSSLVQPTLVSLRTHDIQSHGMGASKASRAIAFELDTAPNVTGQVVATVDVDMRWAWPPGAIVDARAGPGAAETASPSPAPSTAPRTALSASSGVTRILAALTDSFRRLFGPYVWVPPERWDVESILRSNFPLYPGMVVWYAALPLLALGVGTTIVRAVRGLEQRAALVTLAIFLLIYFVQYLVLNLSYRQRDTMLPFLAIFGLMGLYGLVRSRPWRAAYRLYWLILVLIAFAHSVVRATLSAA